jgi:hypothetical protein
VFEVKKYPILNKIRFSGRPYGRCQLPIYFAIFILVKLYQITEFSCFHDDAGTDHQVLFCPFSQKYFAFQVAMSNFQERFGMIHKAKKRLIHLAERP